WASSLRTPQFSSSVVRRSACPLVSALALGPQHRPTSRYDITGIVIVTCARNAVSRPKSVLAGHAIQEILHVGPARFLIHRVGFTTAIDGIFQAEEGGRIVSRQDAKTQRKL